MSVSVSPKLNMKLFQLFFVCFAFALPFSVFAQNGSSTPKKGDLVVLKIPMEYFGKVTKISISGRNNYDIEVSKNSDSLILNKKDFQINGWVFMQAFTVAKVSQSKNKTEVNLENENVKIELHFNGESKENIGDLFFIGSLDDFKKTDFYQQKLIGEVLPKIFPSKLSKISTVKQLKILEAFNYNVRRFEGEEFKGKLYLTVNVEQDVVYNTIQVNQAERAAKTIEKVLSENIKLAAKAIDESGIDGIKVETEVYFKDFLKDRYTESQSEKLEVYLPLDLVKQWVEADITNQQLVDKSIILINGNRVQVVLTQFN